METRLYANEYEAEYCSPTIKIVTDNPDQFQKNHRADAGFDIISSEPKEIYAGCKALISTKLQVAIPRGYVGILKSRSGLAVKHNLEVGAGVIDSGYTGEIRVVLRNLGERAYTVSPGDKIAQMLIIPICNMSVTLVGSLTDSERSDKGFNSSGY